MAQRHFPVGCQRSENQFILKEYLCVCGPTVSPPGLGDAAAVLSRFLTQMENVPAKRVRRDGDLAAVLGPAAEEHAHEGLGQNKSCDEARNARANANAGGDGRPGSWRDGALLDLERKVLHGERSQMLENSRTKCSRGGVKGRKAFRVSSRVLEVSRCFLGVKLEIVGMGEDFPQVQSDVVGVKGSSFGVCGEPAWRPCGDNKIKWQNCGLALFHQKRVKTLKDTFCWRRPRPLQPYGRRVT